MKTLVSTVAVVQSARGDGALLPAESVSEADIVAAEHRHIVPVIGQALHERLLAGAYADFAAEYLHDAVILFTRAALQPRRDLHTGRTGTTVPRSASGQPADDAARRRARRSLLTQARTLLRRAAAYLDAHAGEFPEYLPGENILKRCTIDGNLVQID